MTEHTPEKVNELVGRLRGDILDAVPDDNDMQHVLELAADALTAVSAERDAAIRDLDAGFAESDHLSAKYYQRMRDAEREMHARELHHFKEEQARAKAEAERDEALSAIASIRAARSNHPECDVHDDADPVTCGWKRTVQDIDTALSRIPEHPKED